MTPTAPAADKSRPNRRQERHLQVRREILDTAWALAREVGLAGVSLGEVARRVGMRTPSLYHYFPSKNDVFDAMFEEGARAHLAWVEGLRLPVDRRVAFAHIAKEFLEFCVADTPRYQLLFQRTIPGFEPSAEAYAPAVRVMEVSSELFGGIGVSQPRHLELAIAVMIGAVDQKISNERGDAWWQAMVEDVTNMLYNFIVRHHE